jgi:hypothetical protein
MKRIIRLTESDLTRIVRRVIMEQTQPDPKILQSFLTYAKNTFTPKFIGIKWPMPQGTSTMNVISVEFSPVAPENQKNNGQIQVILNTNTAGLTKRMAIGLSADETKQVKIVQRGKPVDITIQNLYLHFAPYFGQYNNTIVSRSINQKPNPYDLLLAGLTEVAKGYQNVLNRTK